MPLRDLLANLWSRHAILQCSHNKGSHDFVAAAYFGDVTDGAFFDPTKLAPFYGQVKLKIRPDTKAARSLRPIGIPRIANHPHLAILMELGTDAKRRSHHVSVMRASTIVKRHFTMLKRHSKPGGREK